MKRIELMALLVAVLGLTLGTACGDDSGGGGGDGDGDTSPDGGDGDVATNWEDDFPQNLDCPEGVPPNEGEGSQHGACCFRGKPNSVRLQEQGDSALAAVGYRMNAQGPGNLFETLGAAPLPDLAIARADLHEQILLIKVEGPYENGESISGPGISTVGGGVYNCDGTYSYYGDQAAPNAADLVGATYPGAGDTDRWVAREIPVTIDAEKTDIQERITYAWEDAYKGFSYTSFIESGTNPFEIDWEIVTENFELIDFPYNPDDVNCLGERTGDTWETGGSFAVYAQIQFNNDKANDIVALAGQNFCQLVSFGVLSTADDLANLDCETTPRCAPGTDGCRWKALPDSLCPETDGDRENWACHVGAEDNVDGYETNCTAEAPTGHPEDNDGQCCSSLGDDPDLPPCNAWRIVNDVVAASANITDEPSQNVIDVCPAE